MKATTRRHSPVLAAGYTRGLHARLHSLTGPIWAQWCEAHGYLFRPELIPATDRHGALTAKIPIMLRHLAAGHPCLWADVDLLPVLDSPDPAAGVLADRPIAAVVLPSGHPKSGHVTTGIFYARAEARDVLLRAVALQNCRRHAGIDQRALSAAILELPEIPRVEDPPKRSMPVHRLPLSWLCGTSDRIPASRRAFAWHASTLAARRVPTLELWIAQSRHRHSASLPLPSAWRIRTVLPS